jgi:hypothetical protein
MPKIKREAYLKLKDILHLLELLLVSVYHMESLAIEPSTLGWHHPGAWDPIAGPWAWHLHPLGTNAPGSELLEALLVMATGALVTQLAGGRAEGAGGAGRDDHSRHGEEGAGATGLEAAEAIGAEEGRRPGARGHA